MGDLLQSYRQDARVNGAVTFGMNVIVLQGIDPRLKVGQPVAANDRFGVFPPNRLPLDPCV